MKVKRKRRCKTGKKVFYRELIAIRAALRITANPALKPTRAYRCNFCQCWHLTTQMDRYTKDLFKSA